MSAYRFVDTGKGGHHAGIWSPELGLQGEEVDLGAGGPAVYRRPLDLKRRLLPPHLPLSKPREVLKAERVRGPL